MSAPSSASSAAPSVAFGLTQPLLAGLHRIRRRPGAALLPTLVLLLPLVPVVLAIRGVLRAGADVALTELIAGAPRGAEGAVIVRPDGFGVRLLVLLALLLVVGVAVIVAAGLVVGAATAGSRSAGEGLRRAWAAWPLVALWTVVIALAVAVVAGAVIAVAVLAGRVRFQLTSVVLVLGLGAIAVVLMRLSLWPALALERDVPLRAAVARSWRSTRGNAVRLVLAALVALAAVALPTYLVGLLIGFVLDRLADAEVLALSPVAIGLWSLVLVPVAVVVGAVVWGAGARAVALAVDEPG
ncbi:hypothetical protein [Patulibacter minatonensis]|uniref:hypothetical protein n=1 Tax=Patulibacter minatonensis TaxID=298163 RepID=UPI00047AC950|nr:hypothetical protein [Patulibacter minatonensis]